jgi:hypothetical protein
VSDVVQEIVAVEDHVCLMDREDRAGCELWICRQVPMGVDRDEPRDVFKMGPGFTLLGASAIRTIAPGGWPKAVVVDVENDAVDRPVEPSS